jgi:hypothetical protein
LGVDSMNFREWAKSQEAAGLAEVHTITELQYAEIGEGPWKIYCYQHDGYHSGGMWFRKGPMKYPDEEITLSEAKRRSDAYIAKGLEVKVCDGGDMLVFHSVNGAVVYGEGFWEAVTR